MITSSATQQISLSRVAEMADSTPQAVSNWRKRFDNFPRPIAGTDRRPLFDSDEVVSWLKANDRLGNEPGFATRVWALMDGLRGYMSPDDAALLALSAIAWKSLSKTQVPKEFTKAGTSVSLPSDLRISREVTSDGEYEQMLGQLVAWAGDNLRYPYDGIFTQLREALPRVGRLYMTDVMPAVVEPPTNSGELEDALDKLFGRAGSPDVAGRTPAQIRELATSLLDIRDGDTVLDAASGTGSFLLHIARNFPQTRRVGVEIQHRQLGIAALASILTRASVDLHWGDSILNDPVSDLIADRVFIDPPFGARITEVGAIQGDPRWIYGVPTGDYGFAWVQHALARVSQSGRSIVVLPSGDLASKRGQSIRASLIKSGVVEAVIALPKGTYPWASLAPALWVLRKALKSGSRADEILLVDASESAAGGGMESLEWVESVVAEYRAGRPVSPGPRAGAIAVVDLLSEGSNLSPSRWLAAAELPEQGTIDTRVQEITSALSQLMEIQPSTRLEIDRVAAPMVKLSDLIKAKSLKVFRGKQAPPKSIREAGSVPYLTPARLGMTGSQVVPKYVDDWAADALVKLTEPGDIAIWADASGVRAVVLQAGGAAPSPNLQILRISDGTFDPDYLAACIASKHNERFLAGSSFTQPRVRDFEVPSLMSSEQQRLGQEIRNISTFQARAAEVTAQLAELSGLLADALGEGVLRLRTT